MFEKMSVRYKTFIQEVDPIQKISMLKVKVKIKGPQITPKKSCFIASINCKESVTDQSQENKTYVSKIISLHPKKMKINAENNRCKVLWEFPIHHYLTNTDHTSTIKHSSQNKLTILYISDVDRQRSQKDYTLQFNQCYNVNSENYKKMHHDQFIELNENESLQKAIEHELILHRSNKNKIPIILRLNSTVFDQSQNKKIQIQLQSLLSERPLPQVQVVLYNRFVFEENSQAYKQLIMKDSKRFLGKEGQDNHFNSELDFELDLDQLDIAPLYLGQIIQSHHILLIKIVFEKQNCFDFSLRKFDLFVPIEIINQNQDNQNQDILKKKGYYKAQSDIIKLDIWPYFSQLYQNYLKIEVLNEQKLKFL